MINILINNYVKYSDVVFLIYIFFLLSVWTATLLQSTTFTRCFPRMQVRLLDKGLSKDLNLSTELAFTA